MSGLQTHQLHSAHSAFYKPVTVLQLPVSCFRATSKSAEEKLIYIQIPRFLPPPV